MPTRFVRYKPNHGPDGIGGFLLSDQLQDAVDAAARDVIAYAKPESSTLAPDWASEKGPVVVVAGNPRVSANVTNDNRAAASIEFGSGPGAKGASGAKPRPQGGSSEPKRILGRAGARVGDLRGEIG